MLKNRLLFILKRYDYDDNIILIINNLTFVKTLI